MEEQENLISLKKDYFRIQISNPKKRSPMNNDRFYSDIIGSDEIFKRSYRSYKTTKLSALKVTNIKLNMIGVESDED